MTEATQTQTKGRGRIEVSPGIEPEGVQIPRFGQVVFDLIEAKPMFDLWESHLLLPDNYSIYGVYFDVIRKRWILDIESEDIPVTSPGEIFPEIIPSYLRTEDGKVKLTDIKMWDDQVKEYRILREGANE